MNTPTTSFKRLPMLTVLASSLALFACGGGGGGSSDSGNTEQPSNNTPSTNTPSTNTPSTNPPSTNPSSGSALEANAAIAKNFVNNLAIPAYKQFATNSTTLGSTVQSYCDSLGKSNEATALTNAKKQWLSLKNEWQATRAFAVGPTDKEKGLSKRIYTEGNAFDNNVLGFMQDEIDKRKADSTYMPAAGVNFKTRGLDALEYLLYTPQSNAAIKKDNCNYAVVVAKDVKLGADAIVTAWADPKIGKTFVLTPQTSTAVDLIQPFFNNVVTVVDKTIKDAGLGEPLALKSGSSCNKDACPELVENRLSKTTYDSLKANLASVEKLFTGAGDKGFSTFFSAKGMTKESAAFANLITEVATALDQKQSLHEQVSTIEKAKKGDACTKVADSGQTQDADLTVCQTYNKVKKLSDDVKTGSFKLAVNLTIPSASAGDGD